MTALGYIKLKSGLGLAFGAYFCMYLHTNALLLIMLYQLTKLQFHIFFSFQVSNKTSY